MRDPERVYLDDSDKSGYLWRDVEAMIDHQTWTDDPEDGTLPFAVRRERPELFARAVENHRRREAEALESIRKTEEVRQRMMLPPCELSIHEQKLQKLWNRWNFPTHFNPEGVFLE